MPPQPVKELGSNRYKLMKLYGRDGAFLGDCSFTKSQWYLRKNLEELVDENTIKLLFENQTETATYHVVKRDYLCISCGDDEKLSRYRIVPSHFKKWMPETYKSHSSKDVYLLCVECMADANFCCEMLRKTLKVEYNISDNDFIDLEKYTMAQSALNLIHNRHIRDSQESLTKLLGYEPNQQQIIDCSTINFYVTHDGCTSASEYIMKQVMKNGQLDDFIQRWRDYFIKTMEPKFMPQSI